VKKTDLAYVAGVVDADGCIRFHREKYPTRGGIKHSYHAVVIVTNTNKWLVEWLRFSFGGTVYKHAEAQNERQERCWRWYIKHQKAADFLRLILPYLKMKRDQAVLAIEFQSHKIQGKRPIEAVAEAEMILKMHQFNKG